MVLVVGLLLFGHVDTDLRLYNRLFASIANPSHGIENQPTEETTDIYSWTTNKANDPLEFD